MSEFDNFMRIERGALSPNQLVDFVNPPVYSKWFAAVCEIAQLRAELDKALLDKQKAKKEKE